MLRLIKKEKKPIKRSKLIAEKNKKREIALILSEYLFLKLL